MNQTQATLIIKRATRYADELYDVVVLQGQESIQLGSKKGTELSFRLNEMTFIDSDPDTVIERARATGQATAQIMWPD